MILYVLEIFENFRYKLSEMPGPYIIHSASPRVSELMSESMSLRSSLNLFSLSDSASLELSEDSELELDSSALEGFCLNLTGEDLRAGDFFRRFLLGLPDFFLAPDTKSRLISSVFLPVLVDSFSGFSSS